MEKGTMEDYRQIIVNEHIADLRRDATEFRVTRRAGRHIRDGDRASCEVPEGQPARVRLGRWLIGLGTAVAGSASERRDGTAGSAL
jgi:hypothetical protein